MVGDSMVGLFSALGIDWFAEAAEYSLRNEETQRAAVPLASGVRVLQGSEAEWRVATDLRAERDAGGFLADLQADFELVRGTVP